MISLYQTTNKYLAAFISLFMKMDFSVVGSDSFKRIGTKEIIRTSQPIVNREEVLFDSKEVSIVSNHTFLNYRTAGIHNRKILIYTLLGGITTSFVVLGISLGGIVNASYKGSH